MYHGIVTPGGWEALPIIFFACFCGLCRHLPGQDQQYRRSHQEKTRTAGFLRFDEHMTAPGKYYKLFTLTIFKTS